MAIHVTEQRVLCCDACGRTESIVRAGGLAGEGWQRGVAMKVPPDTRADVIGSLQDDAYDICPWCLPDMVRHHFTQHVRCTPTDAKQAAEAESLSAAGAANWAAGAKDATDPPDPKINCVGVCAVCKVALFCVKHRHADGRCRYCYNRGQTT